VSEKKSNWSNLSVEDTVLLWKKRLVELKHLLELEKSRVEAEMHKKKKEEHG
jgi:hypothetical protein